MESRENQYKMSENTALGEKPWKIKIKRNGKTNRIIRHQTEKKRVFLDEQYVKNKLRKMETGNFLQTKDFED